MRYRVGSCALVLYRSFLSPLFHSLAGPGFGCRFLPTCSEYASEALQVHGYWKGGFLTLFRISRCHPFSKAGLDPVPHAIAESNFKDQKR